MPTSTHTGMRIGLVLFPRLTQLDLTAPYEVFARVPGATVELVGAARGPVQSEFGLTLHATAARDEIDALDVVCVPGGPGIGALLADGAWLDWLARIGASASWVTSVCTGALVLGAAGLLDGYRATTHWLSLDLLPLCGAIPTAGRVVRDRNRITGGGVTAGLDFALTLAGLFVGDRAAQQIQLLMEYQPEPPYPVGREHYPSEVAALRAERAALQAERARLLVAARPRR